MEGDFSRRTKTARSTLMNELNCKDLNLILNILNFEHPATHLTSVRELKGKILCILKEKKVKVVS